MQFKSIQISTLLKSQFERGDSKSRYNEEKKMHGADNGVGILEVVPSQSRGELD